MTSDNNLQTLIDLVRGRLQAENIDLDDHDACIKCLKKTVQPVKCIEIYDKHISHKHKRSIQIGMGI